MSYSCFSITFSLLIHSSPEYSTIRAALQRDYREYGDPRTMGSAEPSEIIAHDTLQAIVDEAAMESAGAIKQSGRKRGIDEV